MSQFSNMFKTAVANDHPGEGNDWSPEKFLAAQTSYGGLRKGEMMVVSAQNTGKSLPVMLEVLERKEPGLTAGLDLQAINQQANQLRTLDMMGISKFGSETSTAVSKLAADINSKVKGSDSGAMGKGIQDILVLTETVDLDAFAADDAKPGLLNRAKNFFKKSKVQMLAQYEDVQTQIDKIGQTMLDGVTRLEKDYEWLEQMYEANLQQIRDLRLSIAVVSVVLVEKEAELAALQADGEATAEKSLKVADLRTLVDRLSKHQEKLRKVQALAELNGPEIRGLQVAAVNQQIKFKDLFDISLPLWSKQFSLEIQAARLKKDGEISKAVDDMTNNAIRRSADMMKQALVLNATNSQRSVVETETLAYKQQVLISGLQEAKRIEAEGRKARAESMQRMESMQQDLQKEMSTW